METKVTAGKKVLNTLKSVKDSCIKVLSNLGKKKDCGCKKG